MRVDAGADQSGVEQLANSDFVFVAGGPVRANSSIWRLAFPANAAIAFLLTSFAASTAFWWLKRGRS
jgi:hypothetical protein